MDGITTEAGEELLIFSDENDIGSFVGAFDDVLKDPLLSWPETDDQLIDLPTSSGSDPFSQCVTTEGQYSLCQNNDTQHFNHLPYNTVHNNTDDGRVVQKFSNVCAPGIKVEPREAAPELVKLLQNHDFNEPVAPKQISLSQITRCSDPVLNANTNAIIKQQPILSVSQVPTMTVPVQLSTAQAQKLVISPQQPSTVQICSLLPTSKMDTTVVSVPSVQQLNSAFPKTQFVTTTTPQTVPVQQLILHTQIPSATTTTTPIQLVIDPSSLPLQTTQTTTIATPTTATPRAEKHRAHNAIEKKYRTSINDKIGEMRKLLFGEDAKIQKSGVLKKAVDHIKQLRSINSRLRQENIAFKIKLQQLGLLSCLKPDDPCAMNTNDILSSPLTPESMGDLASSSGSPPSSPSKSDDSENSAMLDRTRVGLCIVMLSFFVFDPFNLVLNWQRDNIWRWSNARSNSPVHGNGRFLMAEDSLGATQEPGVFIIFNIISWLLRSVIIGFLFLKLFVFGEPVLQPDSKVATKYWSFKAQADQLIQNGDYITGSKVLKRCLEAIGRPFPTSRLDMAFSLLWQILKQVVHRFWITRWITRKAVKYFTFRAVVKQQSTWIKESAKQASLIYHKLHQLYLTGSIVGNSWLATIISLNAVNLAELAGNEMKEEMLVEIYIDASIQLRSTLPAALQFLARYFLGRARRLCRGQSLTLPYACWWLFTPVGHRFFVSGKWSSKKVQDIWNSSNNNENKPLDNVTHTFCRYLLEQSLSTLLVSSKNNEIGNTEDDGKRVQAFDTLDTLSECVDNSRASNINRNVKVFGDFTSWPSKEANTSGVWWTAVAKTAACWLTSDVDAGRKQRVVIENIPDEIERHDDPIGRAILMAFSARSRLLENKEAEKTQEILEYCDKGAALLRESIAYSAVYPADNILKLIHLLCSDWILSTRVELWEKMKDEKDVFRHFNKQNQEGFYKTLKNLQTICFNMPEVMAKVYMYETAYRMMCGANPIKTRQLFEKTKEGYKTNTKMRDGTRSSSSLSSEKDKTTAMIMASSNIPASLFATSSERREMIMDALESLQNIGEKDRVARCRKLLLSM